MEKEDYIKKWKVKREEDKKREVKKEEIVECRVEE